MNARRWIPAAVLGGLLVGASPALASPGAPASGTEVAGNPAPAATTVEAVCATADDHFWLVRADPGTLVPIVYATNPEFTGSVTLSAETGWSGQVLGDQGVGITTARTAGATLYVRLAGGQDLTASATDRVCPDGSITVRVDVQGGAAKPGDFETPVRRVSPPLAYQARDPVTVVAGTPVAVVPGYLSVDVNLDALPAGYTWSALFCGQDPGGAYGRPLLVWLAPALGSEAPPSLECTARFSGGRADRHAAGDRRRERPDNRGRAAHRHPGCLVPGSRVLPRRAGVQSGATTARVAVGSRGAPARSARQGLTPGHRLGSVPVFPAGATCPSVRWPGRCG